MIARPLPYETRPGRSAGTRAGRGAVERRVHTTRRNRYAGLARVFATTGILVIFVVAYLGLMANVTRMNYELARLAQDRARLLDATAIDDDAIATAESNERLQQDARILHMVEPQTFVSIAQPRARAVAPHDFAFLRWLK